MAQFLSRTWIEELKRAAEGCPDLVGTEALPAISINQVVTEAPGGQVGYVLKISNGRLQVLEGADADPTVTLIEDYATAAAISKGELNAGNALMAGKIRVKGDISALIGVQELLQRAHRCLDKVREQTTY